MTYKFTPGPWEVVDEHPNRSCLEIRKVGVGIPNVATLYIADGNEKYDENDILRNDDVRIANAQLIAAAPTLVKALFNLENAIRNKHADPTIQIRLAEARHAMIAAGVEPHGS